VFDQNNGGKFSWFMCRPVVFEFEWLKYHQNKRLQPVNTTKKPTNAPRNAHLKALKLTGLSNSNKHVIITVHHSGHLKVAR
jgi:hypothetical protein